MYRRRNGAVYGAQPIAAKIHSCMNAGPWKKPSIIIEQEQWRTVGFSMRWFPFAGAVFCSRGFVFVLSITPAFHPTAMYQVYAAMWTSGTWTLLSSTAPGPG